MRALSSPLLSLSSSSSSSSRKNDRATAKTRSSSSPRSFLQSPSRVTVLRRTNSTRTSSSSFSVKASSSSNEENKEIQVTLVDCFTSDVGKMTSETRKNAEESIMELENARFVSEKYLFARTPKRTFSFCFSNERGKCGFLEESRGRRRVFVVCLFVFFLRVFWRHSLAFRIARVRCLRDMTDIFLSHSALFYHSSTGRVAIERPLRLGGNIQRERSDRGAQGRTAL